MAEWHLPPDYIVDNWTDELLELMCEKLVKRKQRELDAIQGKKGTQGGPPIKPGTKIVSDKELFATMGKKVKVSKNAD